MWPFKFFFFFVFVFVIEHDRPRFIFAGLVPKILRLRCAQKREKKQKKMKNDVVQLQQGNKNHYEILEIEVRATPKQVKQAYRRLCTIHHPDKNNNKDEGRRFQRICQANDVLSNPDRRREYDITTFKKQLKRSSSDCSKPFRVVHVPPIKITKVLSLEQAHVCSEINVSFSRKIECVKCSGLGSNRFKICDTCKGEKWVCPNLFSVETFVTCLTCGGKGVVLVTKIRRKTSTGNSPGDSKCGICQGQGVLTNAASFSFPFPKSPFYNGQFQSFPDKGDQRIDATSPGEVLVKLHVEARHGNYYFKGDGTSLTYFQNRLLSEALAAEPGHLTTLDDRRFAIPRPKTRGPICHGEEVWIQGEGLRGTDNSWLRVVFQIKNPSFSLAQIQIIQTWETETKNHWSAFCGRSG